MHGCALKVCQQVVEPALHPSLQTEVLDTVQTVVHEFLVDGGADVQTIALHIMVLYQIFHCPAYSTQSCRECQRGLATEVVLS